MARKVFFSFHHKRDILRIGQVRNCDMVTKKYTKSKFLDSADWESIKKKGKEAVRSWIDEQLHGTSVTIVLIGNETSTRPWVHYEIQKSWSEGKGLLGIYIHNINAPRIGTDKKGQNPFDYYYVNESNKLVKRNLDQDVWFGVNFPPRGMRLLSNVVSTYDWKANNGISNIETWIENAARQVGR
jgi:hypothetical protein